MFLWDVNNLLKMKLPSPCSPLAAAGGGGGNFFGRGNKVNYGKCANGEQELILARPTICAFVSFFSAMHWNTLSDFIYICFNISKI